jgi:mevalonate kinase
MNISYSAPGKIILSGEHSVTYGKPAFVTGINLRLTIHLSEGKPQDKNEKLHKAFVYIEDIVLKYLQKRQEIKKKDIHYSYESGIPIGRGMGSSAALCVATTAALLHFYSGHEHDKQVINSLAYQAEKYFHGFPSGVDVSASCFGGLIFYRKEFEFLKHISSLNFKIPQTILDNLYLLDSGEPVEDTLEMIKEVGKNYNINPKKMEVCLNNIEKVTKRMVISIVKEDMTMFKEAITENEKLVEELGIVSESTKMLLQSLSKFGAGKVTGAGGLKKGSGMIIFYSTNSAFKDQLSAKKIQLFKFDQDFDGVKKC